MMTLMPVPPKHPSARQRRNKTPGARKLTPVVNPGLVEIPPIPGDREWHPMTLRKWEAIHRSPMFAEYDETDIEGLIALAHLWDDFWWADSPSARVKLQTEIRMNEVRYGLSPIDRRRLSWEIDRGEEAEANVQERRNRKVVRETPSEEEEVDPRALLA